MNRTKFIGIAGGSIIAAVVTSYLLSDKSNLLREDLKLIDSKNATHPMTQILEEL
jgi:hypothetical protein